MLDDLGAGFLTATAQVISGGKPPSLGLWVNANVIAVASGLSVGIGTLTANGTVLQQTMDVTYLASAVVTGTSALSVRGNLIAQAGASVHGGM